MPSAEDCATLQAYLTGVDATAREHEAKWGMDRLPMLVDDELRAKFFRQRAKWSGHMAAAWEAQFVTRDMLDAVASSSAGLRRGWQALDAAAEVAGHRPIAPYVWEATLKDGTVAAVVQTVAEASKVCADGRHRAVYTMDEIANIIDALPAAITVAKVEFPGSKVLPQSDRSWAKAGEEIPF